MCHVHTERKTEAKWLLPPGLESSRLWRWMDKKRCEGPMEVDCGDETTKMLEGLRKLSEETVAFIPHSMKEMFARAYSRKINELSMMTERGRRERVRGTKGDKLDILAGSGTRLV